MDATGYFIVYFLEGIVFFTWIFLAYKTLKHQNKRLNKTFASFYLSIALGLFFNFIFAPLIGINGLEMIVQILNLLTIFFISLGLINLVSFLLILLKSEKSFTTDKQIKITVLYGIAIISIVFFLPFEGVVINESTNWAIKYSLPFYLYLISVISIGAIIPSIYYSIKIYNEMQDSQLKKKFKFFILGVFELFIFMYGIYTTNYLNIPSITTLWMAIGTVLVISGAYLTYFGVGKQIK